MDVTICEITDTQSLSASLLSIVQAHKDQATTHPVLYKPYCSSPRCHKECGPYEVLSHTNSNSRIWQLISLQDWYVCRAGLFSLQFSQFSWNWNVCDSLHKIRQTQRASVRLHKVVHVSTVCILSSHSVTSVYMYFFLFSFELFPFRGRHMNHLPPSEKRISFICHYTINYTAKLHCQRADSLYPRQTWHTCFWWWSSQTQTWAEHMNHTKGPLVPSWNWIQNLLAEEQVL